MIFPVIITQTIFPRLHTTPVSLLIKPSLLALVLYDSSYTADLGALHGHECI